MRNRRDQLREIVFVVFFTAAAVLILSFLTGCLSANKQQAAYTNSELALDGVRRNGEWLKAVSARLTEVEGHDHAEPISESVPWWGWLLGGGTVAGGGAGLVKWRKR